MSVCGNNCGISLLAVAGKILAKDMFTRFVQLVSERLFLRRSVSFGKKDRWPILFLLRGNCLKSVRNSKGIYIYKVY